jgi:L-amino acid N-acyltransferase YncA
MNYVIRRRERKDCEAIAKLITICWNETYRGLVSDEFLDGLYKNEEDRIKNSYEKFDENDNHQFVLEVDGKVVGWMNIGDSDEGSEYGEIHAIYILNDYKGFGYGRKLVEEGIKEIKSMGFKQMIIGCLDGNKSNEFYKHIGGKFIKQRMFEKLGMMENVYLFEEI